MVPFNFCTDTNVYHWHFRKELKTLYTILWCKELWYPNNALVLRGEGWWLWHKTKLIIKPTFTLLLQDACEKSLTRNLASFSKILRFGEALSVAIIWNRIRHEGDYKWWYKGKTKYAVSGQKITNHLFQVTFNTDDFLFYFNTGICNWNTWIIAFSCLVFISLGILFKCASFYLWGSMKYLKNIGDH